MNRLVILLIALIFLNNCSLNENSRIWKDKELSTQPKLKKVFEEKTGKTLLCHKEATPFAFAGPDEFKYDTSIDTFTAYKRYISSKPWVASNYLRDPSRKPNWV